MARNKKSTTPTTTTEIVTPALMSLPKLPKAARKPKPLHACACGCGGTTTARFMPGHDSRLKGWVLRVERNIVKLADIPEGERQAVAAHMKAAKATSAAA